MITNQNENNIKFLAGEEYDKNEHRAIYDFRYLVLFNNAIQVTTKKWIKIFLTIHNLCVYFFLSYVDNLWLIQFVLLKGLTSRVFFAIYAFCMILCISISVRKLCTLTMVTINVFYVIYIRTTKNVCSKTSWQ